jgi:DNA-binding Lrp family transcriptional regulator
VDELDKRILDNLQGGFPLCDEPFREVADSLGIEEDDLIARIGRMLEERTLTRFGPMYQAEKMGGAFMLAAMSVPEEAFEGVAEIVNALPEVAHNYRREHVLNMWFVLATEKPEGVPVALEKVTRATGLEVLTFPKLREYFVGMRLTPLGSEV